MMLDLENIYTYHPPTGTQVTRYTALREQAKALAYLIAQSTPESREQSIAFTKLEEAVFWANAAIARNENPTPPPQPPDDELALDADAYGGPLGAVS